MAVLLTEYFTLWSLVVVLLHAYTHAHVHLLALTAFVCLAGMWLTHVHPRQYVLFDLKIAGANAVAVNVALHVIPFVFVAWAYGRYYAECHGLGTLPGTLLIFVAYAAYVRGDLASVYKTPMNAWLLMLAYAGFVTAFALIPCLMTKS